MVCSVPWRAEDARGSPTVAARRLNGRSRGRVATCHAHDDSREAAAEAARLQAAAPPGAEGDQKPGRPDRFFRHRVRPCPPRPHAPGRGRGGVAGPLLVTDLRVLGPGRAPRSRPPSTSGTPLLPPGSAALPSRPRRAQLHWHSGDAHAPSARSQQRDPLHSQRQNPGRHTRRRDFFKSPEWRNLPTGKRV